MTGKGAVIVRPRDMKGIYELPEDKADIFSRKIVLTAKDKKKPKM